MYALVRHEREHAAAAVGQDLELDGAADLISREHTNEIAWAGDHDPLQRQNDVAGQESRAFGGASRLDAGDHHRALLSESGCVPTSPRERELLSRDTDIGTPHPPMSHQLAEHEA